jgi:SPP1 family predicted phage head-tail adaptor
MSAGSLRERVTLQRQVVNADGMGGEVRSWANWRTLCAEVLPTRGDETILGEGLVGRQGYVVKVRFVRDIDITRRVIWRGMVLNVVAAVDRTGKRMFTWITTDSGLVTD